MNRSEREANVAILKRQSELETGRFISHPDVRVTDDVAARTEDALGHVKQVIKDVVTHAGQPVRK